jgi:hypothetical protein
MFYFASDNPLAISIVSQLKAIKSAGHHPEANVIVHFDPVTEGTPTHVFDVNLINKLQSNGRPQIGFNGNDPFVRSLVEDRLWGSEVDRRGREIRSEIASLFPNYNPPKPINGRPASPRKSVEPGNGNRREPSPEQSLGEFLELCSKYYPARHYMLFILGHGVVVGNDVFLFDQNAEEQSLKLGALGELLRKFKADVKNTGSFDLVGFHSCSVSSLEVAYELQDTAKYMLASQGTAFVGSWPYKQILMRIFSELDGNHQMGDQAIRQTLEKIFSYCLHNSTDFLMAGYPFDLCLCDLSQISSIKEPLGRLSQSLIKALDDPKTRAQCANLTILAHWRSQSFYLEMYTDVYDFCFCLKNCIEELPEPQRVTFAQFQADCEAEIEALEQDSRSDSLIVRSEFAGPEYQYSHGFSLYFPWSTPSADSRVLEEYANYKITTEFEPEQRWLTFLKSYLDRTMRAPRSTEPSSMARQQAMDRQKEAALLLRSRNPELYEDMVNSVYTQEGPRNGQNALDQRSKTDPKDPTGGDCSCPSIKNYPKDTRNLRELTEPTASVTFSERFFVQSV